MPHAILLSTWSFGQRSNAPGWAILAKGGSSLDAVEAVGRFAEADLSNRTVGVGGLPDASGRVSLDAMVMLSPAKRGGVANIRRFPHPVSIARKVMESTQHILLAGAEADEFAEKSGFEPQELLTEDSRRDYEQWRKENPDGAYRPMRNIEERILQRNEAHDTIGVIGMDAKGTLAGCCTTSGMPFKLPGRVGDSPIPGHGLYVDPEAGAAVATGHGELVMGICGAFLAVEAMRRGASPEDAALEVLERMKKAYKLTPDDQVGIITLSKTGQWSGASLYSGFSIAVRTSDRDELVDSPRVMFKE